MNDYAGRHWRDHQNRREQTPEGRQRNILDGLRCEAAVAEALILRGVGFEYPSKRGTEPDLVDFIVRGEQWSVKGSRMWVPTICAAQRHHPADRYVFMAIRGEQIDPLGTITAERYWEVARLVAKGEAITDRFTAHYDLYVCGRRELEPFERLLERLSPMEAA